MPIQVKNLRPLTEYQAQRASVFPSMSSLNWFVRQHRDQLAKCNAVGAPTGRLLVDPERFDRYVARQTSGRAVRRTKSTAE